MERRLASTKTSELAIYVTPTNDKILSVLSEVTSSSGKSTTATQQLLNTISANTFQVFIYNSYHFLSSLLQALLLMHWLLKILAISSLG